MSARAVPVPAPQNISRNIFPDYSRHILITGASAGLGAALAEAYAAPGMRLSLARRNAERLTAVAAICVA
jgi:short-subunit dehydrogenase